MMSRKLILVLLLTLIPSVKIAAQTAEKPIVGAMATAKFGPVPNAPECFTIAVEKGDPMHGASVILARFAPGCVAPFHWHSPSETVMVTSGALETQMKGDQAIVAHSGDFLFLPSHHTHRATCTGSDPCMAFLTSDAAFDIHWVDADGKEISLEQAVQHSTK